MFDLALIERVFNEGVTRCYESRSGDAQDPGSVDMARAASVEFAKLRKAVVGRAIDAAIRERDELRRGLSEMRELAADFERDRDRAEAELAALKKSIADAPRVAVLGGGTDMVVSIPRAQLPWKQWGDPREYQIGFVRLLMELDKKDA